MQPNLHVSHTEKRTHPLLLLIADDEPEMRLVLREAFKPFSSVIHEASDGRELFAYVFMNHGTDLVISDIRMPNLTGLDAAIMVRKVGLAVPFLFYSAQVDSHTAREVEKLGFAILLRKPSELSSIVTHAYRLIGMQR